MLHTCLRIFSRFKTSIIAMAKTHTLGGNSCGSLIERIRIFRCYDIKLCALTSYKNVGWLEHCVVIGGM